ncbi:RING finger protein [Endozoicomonas lisbonensis]|uniref:RING-type domain-containing protein n=1 Tax=Endozoicomonas lisbonensis TaxID=3120522 RepID=A0ABV2SDF6_9GAMM
MKVITIGFEMIVKGLFFILLLFWGKSVIADTYHIKKLIQSNQQVQQTARKKKVLTNIHIGTVTIDLTTPDIPDHERFSYQPTMSVMEDNQSKALLDLFFGLITLPQTPDSTESSVDAAMSVLLGIFHHQAIHWRTASDATRQQWRTQIQESYNSYTGRPTGSRRGNRNRNRNFHGQQTQVQVGPITFDNYFNPTSNFHLDPDGLVRVDTGIMALMTAFFGPLLFQNQETFEAHLLTATQALIVRVLQRAAGQNPLFNPSNPDFSHFSDHETFARFLRERGIANDILLALALKSFSRYLRAQSQPAENDPFQLWPDYQTVLNAQLPSNISRDIFISLFIAQLRALGHSIQRSEVEAPYDLGLWANRARSLGTLFFPVMLPTLRVLNTPSARSLPYFLVNGGTATTASSNISPEALVVEGVPQRASLQHQVQTDTTENNQNEPANDRDMFTEISAILMDILSNMRIQDDPNHPEATGQIVALNPNNNIRARQALFHNLRRSIISETQIERFQPFRSRAYLDIATGFSGMTGNNQGPVNGNRHRAASNSLAGLNPQNIRAIHNIARRTRAAMSQDGILMENAPQDIHDFYSFLWGLAMPFVTLIPETPLAEEQRTLENAEASTPVNQEPVVGLSQNPAQTSLSEQGATDTSGATSEREPITIPINMCAICLDENHAQLVRFQTCNHAVVCPECLTAYERTRNQDFPGALHTCLYCRRPYEDDDKEIYKPKSNSKNYKQ